MIYTYILKSGVGGKEPILEAMGTAKDMRFLINDEEGTVVYQVCTMRLHITNPITALEVVAIITILYDI